MMSSKLSHNLLPYNQSPYLGIKLFKKVWHTLFKYILNEIYGVICDVIHDVIHDDMIFAS